MAVESGPKHKQPESLNSGLLYWYLWLVIGVLMILVVVYLSLANIYLPQVPSTVGDKINHLLAYGVLAGWFGQLFLAYRHRIVITVGLVLLGTLIEYLQGLTGYRYLDWFDAMANILGVMIALLVLHCGADRILLWFEGRFLKDS